MYEKMAHDDFERAYLKAFWRKLFNWFTGQRNELLAYEEIKSRIPIRGQHDLGLMQVPVGQIIGSVGRYHDFDQAFLPVQTHTRQRWVNIDRAHYEDIILPPVELYKIGEIYFVKDGNHRISVARQRGQKYVDAYIVEINVPGSVSSAKDLDTLVLADEKQKFFEQTNLQVLVPGVTFETQIAGQFSKLLEHVSAHRWYLGERRGSEVAYSDAVLSWYENVYLPVYEVIQDQNLTKSFPEYSPVDLYLWIMDLHWYLRQTSMALMDETEKEIYNKILDEKPDHPIRKLISILMRTDALNRISAGLDYSRFMEQTRLLDLRSDAKMNATINGVYDQLLQHIASHRWFLGEQNNTEIPYTDALLSWYDTVYMPLVAIIREQGILTAFPGKTETDLYVWIIDRQWHLREALGENISIEEAAEWFASEHTSTAQKFWRALFAGEKERTNIQAEQNPETPPNNRIAGENPLED
jgi:uncharacterized membrane protein YfbV (UPF0208 family)